MIEKKENSSNNNNHNMENLNNKYEQLIETKFQYLSEEIEIRIESIKYDLEKLQSRFNAHYCKHNRRRRRQQQQEQQNSNNSQLNDIKYYEYFVKYLNKINSIEIPASKPIELNNVGHLTTVNIQNELKNENLMRALTDGLYKHKIDLHYIDEQQTQPSLEQLLYQNYYIDSCILADNVTILMAYRKYLIKINFNGDILAKYQPSKDIMGLTVTDDRHVAYILTTNGHLMKIDLMTDTNGFTILNDILHGDVKMNTFCVQSMCLSADELFICEQQAKRIRVYNSVDLSPVRTHTFCNLRPIQICINKQTDVTCIRSISPSTLIFYPSSKIPFHEQTPLYKYNNIGSSTVYNYLNQYFYQFSQPAGTTIRRGSIVVVAADNPQQQRVFGPQGEAIKDNAKIKFKQSCFFMRNYLDLNNFILFNYKENYVLII